MHTTWILAADSSRARIFEAHGALRDIHEVDDLVNPEGRSHSRKLQTDAHGRLPSKGDRHQRHEASPAIDAVTHEVELFSKTVSAYLDKARTEHRYDKLCLIASPKFLGLMRQNLSKEAQKLIKNEIPKDVSWFESRDVEAYIKENTF